MTSTIIFTTYASTDNFLNSISCKIICFSTFCSLLPIVDICYYKLLDKEHFSVTPIFLKEIIKEEIMRAIIGFLTSQSFVHPAVNFSFVNINEK